ncbi:rRNA processing/ribosome biogenesis-domain-containing protein [Lentinula detonsa]|uniref:Pre-rRNA-processing protein RIX1 n=1 Tax=Lentinula detonsa TaxID=2804962 RepID=A0A9W8NS11_9AGAR|nr:rRNA processing/ribosome biogenesis-domain-containing protein [Lentinula detonsa]
MDSTHPLKALLNFHLASDTSAVAHLPYILEILNSEHFFPSPHLTKWTARLSSLLHSKESGARWAGLCLAHKTSVYSKSIMIECAQSWLSIAIPILYKKEPFPTYTASINLCRMVFSSATDTPEFQRQVSTPNVPKFTAALIIFLEKESDLQLKQLVLKTLTRLVPLYPNIHRTSHAALSSIVSRIFAQSAPNHISQQLVGPASRLYSILHYTGGKVGAANLWRKSLDESMGSAWTAFIGVRTTFPDENGRFPQVQLLHEEPTTSVTLSMERLSTSVRVICDLLQSPTQRPVQVPVGSLTNLASKMILVTVENEASPSIDPIVWAMETAIIPRIWKVACELIKCLCQCVDRCLTPFSSRLLSYIAFHLEQKLPSIQRVPLLETVHALLTHCHPSHSPILSSRLTRIALSGLLVILPSQTDVQSNTAQAADGTIKTKKGKKKARTYEGDELFRTSGDVFCPTTDDANALLITCDILQLLLQSSDVSPALRSMASRVIMAVFLGLPQMMPATLSLHTQVYHTLLCKIREAAIQLGSGTTSAMSQSLNLVLSAASSTGIDQVRDSLRKLDMLIHPRLPPLLRPLPQVDSFTLFRSEESVEEAEERQRLSLEVLSDSVSNATQDVLMDDSSKTASFISRALPSTDHSISLPRTSVVLTGRADTGAPPFSSSSIIPQEKPTVLNEQRIDPGIVPLSPAPSSVAAAKPTGSLAYPPQTNRTTYATHPAAVDTLDVDEDMPSINLESDSDSD